MTVAATFSTASKAAAVAAVATTTNSWVSLHTSDPGTTSGTAEVSGGTYARKQTTWTAGVGSTVTINVPSGVTITHYAVNSAVTSGSIAWSEALAASETYGSAGTYALTITLSD